MGRRLGQHFLIRDSVLARLAKAVCPARAPLVVEIGPGRGALTRHLLDCCDRLIAIELDPALAAHLRQKYAGTALEVVEADVLSVALDQWGPAVIAGNLPYYITSPIVEKILAVGDTISLAVLLMQKEVAERITAAPGSRDYGYLSVLAQTLARVEYLFTVPPGAFAPPPKVDSAAIRLTPLNPQSVWNLTDPRSFFDFASLCFRQKRKTLRNNLAVRYRRTLLDDLPDTQRRAEQLPIPELIALYRALQAAG